MLVSGLARRSWYLNRVSPGRACQLRVTLVSVTDDDLPAGGGKEVEAAELTATKAVSPTTARAVPSIALTRLRFIVVTPPVDVYGFLDEMPGDDRVNCGACREPDAWPSRHLADLR